MLTPEKSDDDEFDPETIRETVKRHVLRSFGLPVDDEILVPRIPKTTSGKVSRHLCEQIYREARTS